MSRRTLGVVLGDTVEEGFTYLQLEGLALEVMAVMRRYGHELRNVTADRRSELKELIEKVASQEDQQ